MSENPRRGRQARNFTTNVPKILDLKSSSEQIFFRKLSLGAPDSSQTSLSTKTKMSETLSESLNNRKTVNHSEIPASESALQPLLTASQKEHILNELSIEQSNTQQTVNNLYNCTFSLKSKFSASVLMLLIIEWIYFTFFRISSSWRL